MSRTAKALLGIAVASVGAGIAATVQTYRSQQRQLAKDPPERPRT